VTRCFKVELPAGLPLISLNDHKSHWTKRANLTKVTRSIAAGQAKGIPRLEKVKIRAVYSAPDNRRRDASNIFMSVKAAVDGIVDAGVLKDDSDRYVVSVEVVRSPDNIKGGQLTIEVIEVEDEGVFS
jgi:crossover junction endodeoxyribonuclease RusA